MVIDNPTYNDSTGRVVVSRFYSKPKQAWLWSVRVDGAWLGHLGGGLPSVASYAAAYTRTGLRPLSVTDILKEINEDMVLKGLEAATCEK